MIKGTRKKTWNKRKRIGQKGSHFYHLHFDAVETWQIRQLEVTNYCAQNATTETGFMNMKFRSI